MKDRQIILIYKAFLLSNFHVWRENHEILWDAKYNKMRPDPSSLLKYDVIYPYVN